MNSLSTLSNHDNQDSPSPPNLDEMIKNAYPSKTGLYPHEILVLEYARTFNTEQTAFQKFWLYSYGINNVQAILINLVEREYLFLQDIKFTLNRHTIAQLKPILKKNRIKIPSTKKDMIESLLNSIPKENLWAIFPEKYYGLTNKGRNELEDNQYVIDFHRHQIYDFTPWKVNRLRHLHPDKNIYELILEELDTIAIKHFNDQNYGLYRCVRLDMYNISEHESKHELSFRYLAEILYVDLSGCGNNFSTEPSLFSIRARYFCLMKDRLYFYHPWLEFGSQICNMFLVGMTKKWNVNLYVK